jgi:hypothetical protein
MHRAPSTRQGALGWGGRLRYNSQRTVIETFRPLFDAAAGLDLSDPNAARAKLTARFDPKGAQARILASALRALLAEGRIADRGAAPVRWSRVAKASPATGMQSIDVVCMSGAGPRHVHPNGEVNFCIALDGDPRFDGEPPGWVVFPPASGHVPTVEGGTMLIVYLLPGGAIQFET